MSFCHTALNRSDHVSDYFVKGGKKYFEEGYLELANRTAERRGERIKSLELQIDAAKKVLDTYGYSTGLLHDRVVQMGLELDRLKTAGSE